MSERTKPDSEIHTHVEPLAGKNIIISGGTTGIGRATAVLLGSYGARLLIFGRHEPELREAMAEVEQAGGEVHGVVADQAKGEDIQRVFKEADEKLGRLDVMINNAAVAAARLIDTPEDEWRYVLETNILGYMACCREAAIRMKNSGSGHIVNIGSMSADLREEQSVYVTTKAAIQAFSESFRKEVNELGVKVTLIEPGLTATDLVKLSAEEKNRKEKKQEIMKPEDIAVAVHYCLTQPKRTDVVTLQIRPHMQKI